MVPLVISLSRQIALGVLCVAFVAGCVQKSRFAEGDGRSVAPSTYAARSARSAADARDPTAGLPDRPVPAVRTPGSVIPPIPPIPSATVAPVGPAYVAGGKYPLAWFPPVAETPWRYIVIHHSASPTGGARKFDAEHKAQGWDELGYHFVVGNGTDTADGQIEVGPRWPKQKHGAHAKTPDQRYNNYGIGICLVGNFDDHQPSARQVQSLERLLVFLSQRYRIPPERIIGHQDTGKSTDCPGHVLEAMLPGIRRDAAREAANTYTAITP